MKWADRLRAKDKCQSQPYHLTISLDGLLEARTRLRGRQQGVDEGDLFLSGQADDFLLLQDLRRSFLGAVDNEFAQRAARQCGGPLEKCLLTAGDACLKACVSRIAVDTLYVLHCRPPWDRFKS